MIFRSFILALLPLCPVLAQVTAPASGKITYEVTRPFNRAQVQIMVNGQTVRPGGTLPDGRQLPELPDVITYGQTLTFANGLAREQQDRPNRNTFMRVEGSRDGAGPGGERSPGGNGPGTDGPGNNGLPADPTRARQLRRPVENQTYLDGLNRQRIEVMTVRKDSATTDMYRTDVPLPAPPAEWKDTDKTRKIAGFTCRKATCTLKAVTYTVWYTTDLPFTYSPQAELTPAAGVVLQIESDESSYKATRFDAQPVAVADVTPPAGAKPVTPAELDEIRKKATAEFRQRMLQQFQPRN
jgi:hypothetical protein